MINKQTHTSRLFNPDFKVHQHHHQQQHHHHHYHLGLYHASKSRKSCEFSQVRKSSLRTSSSTSSRPSLPIPLAKFHYFPPQEDLSSFPTASPSKFRLRFSKQSLASPSSPYSLMVPLLTEQRKEKTAK